MRGIIAFQALARARRYNLPMQAGSQLARARLREAADGFVEQFTASVAFDRRLYRQDIRGSIAHCRMLGRTGVLEEGEVQRIVAGLR